jgi:hypothetical protein
VGSTSTAEMGSHSGKTAYVVTCNDIKGQFHMINIWISYNFKSELFIVLCAGGRILDALVAIYKPKSLGPKLFSSNYDITY